MFTCDYNGWADIREEEREALDALDLEPAVPVERRRTVRSGLRGQRRSSE